MLNVTRLKCETGGESYNCGHKPGQPDAGQRAQNYRISGTMQRAKQEQSVAINRGLFLVRYTAAEDLVQPPKITVSADSASKKNISFLLHPDHKEAVLWQPQTSLAVRALAPGKLVVRVVPREDSGSIAATIKIEPLSQGEAVQSPRKSGRVVPRDGKNLSILGHVSGLGDVVVSTNEWLAGPSRPSRIEGLSIDWPSKPSNLKLQYAVKSANPQPNSGRKVELATFVGTRGQATPIVALMLEISGPGAANYQLTVEALFLGATIRRIVGQRVVATGPTGREPLVGLRVNLEAVHQSTRPQAKRIAGKASGGKFGRSGGRVRVFRNRTNSRRTATG